MLARKVFSSQLHTKWRFEHSTDDRKSNSSPGFHTCSIELVQVRIGADFLENQASIALRTLLPTNGIASELYTVVETGTNELTFGERLPCIYDCPR